MVFGVLSSLIDWHDELMNKYGDPRAKDWLLMSSPVPTFLLCVAYVYLVTDLGPKLMQHRKPFELKNVLIVYNAVLVASSSYFVVVGIWWFWVAGVTFRCDPCDFSTNPVAMTVASAAWWYYFSKFVEFLDTIFFVLRKKNNQISTLHVVHHASMPMGVWFGASLYPGGHTMIFGILNSFVHMVMYSYYLLAALGPAFKKYLWWKKYLTTFQLVQFALIFVHSTQLFFIECTVPIGFAYLISAYAAVFAVLFSKFYKETYVRGDTKSQTVMRSLNFCTLDSSRRGDDKLDTNESQGESYDKMTKADKTRRGNDGQRANSTVADNVRNRVQHILL